MSGMERECASHEKFDFSEAQPEKLFRHFSDDNLSLNFENFKHLLTELFTDSGPGGKSYDLSKFDEVFHILDKNKDGVIDTTEFHDVYENFIKPLIKPVSALLIIDVQNDFIDGSLAMKNCPAKQEGNEIIAVINTILDKNNFHVTAYSVDSHPEDHVSFLKNVTLYNLNEKDKFTNEIKMFDTVTIEGSPKMFQKLWPVHCVQNSWGSKLHKDLHVPKDSLTIFKGTNSSVDSYSAFFDNMKLSETELHQELKKKNISHVFICGLAFDYCVSFTAIDAAELGYATVVVQDATRGTDENNIRNMEEKLKSVNCVLAQSNEIENLLSGKDIRIEFAATLQAKLKKDILSII